MSVKKKVIIETAKDWMQVTAWSSDGLIEAFKKDYDSCLKILIKAGVFHREMVDYGLVKLADAPKWYRDKNSS